MYKIAIIEDHKPTNDEFKGYLRAEWTEADISQFYDYESAYEALRSATFDLIITDIDLGPGSDKFGGVKLAKAIDGLTCPLLVVSGAPQPETLRGVLGALGAWDYLQKPVLRADFIVQARQAVAFTHRNSGQKMLPLLEEANGATADPDLQIFHYKHPPVAWKGNSISLTVTEIRLVMTLVGNIGNVISKDALQNLLNSGRNVENLRVHIQKIRDAFRSVDPDFKKIGNKALQGYFWRE